MSQTGVHAWEVGCTIITASKMKHMEPDSAVGLEGTRPTKLFITKGHPGYCGLVRVPHAKKKVVSLTA
jgi:hypothetical protein